MCPSNLLIMCGVTLQHMLRSHETALEAGHKELLEREVIFGEDVERILRENPPIDIPSGSDNGSSSNGSNGTAAERVPVGAQGSSRWRREEDFDARSRQKDISQI